MSGVLVAQYAPQPGSHREPHSPSHRETPCRTVASTSENSSNTAVVGTYSTLDRPSSPASASSIPSHILDFHNRVSGPVQLEKLRYSIRVNMGAKVPSETDPSHHSRPERPTSPVWTAQWTVRPSRWQVHVHVHAPRATSERSRAAERDSGQTDYSAVSKPDWKIASTNFGAQDFRSNHDTFDHPPERLDPSGRDRAKSDGSHSDKVVSGSDLDRNSREVPQP